MSYVIAGFVKSAVFSLLISVVLMVLSLLLIRLISRGKAKTA